MADEPEEERGIRAGDIVGYRYLIRDEEGKVLATSTEIVHYLQGGENPLPDTVANRMPGRLEGETFTTAVSKNHAFGSAGTMRRVVLPRERFPQLSELDAGERIGLVLPDGDAVSVWVDDVDRRPVKLEIDHPFAGQELLFEISVISIRVATKSELGSGMPSHPASRQSSVHDVTQELATLRSVLERRFDDEGGAGGLIEILHENERGEARRVDALHEAHATLLARLDEIASRVVAEGADYDHRPALAALVRSLELHDEEGQNLLIDSLYQDTGGEG